MIARTRAYLMKFVTSKKTLRGVGLILLFGILWNVNLSQVIDRLSTVSIPVLLLGILLGFPLKLIRAFRWNQIKHFLEIQSPISKSFYYQIVAGMSMFTPAKIGDFVKTFYLKGDGYSITKTAVSIIGDRLFDLLVVLTVAISAGFYFLPMKVLRNWAWYLSGPVLIVGLLCFMSYFQNLSYKLIRAAFKFIIPDKMHVRARTLIEETNHYFAKLTWGHLSYYVLISVIALFVQVWRIQFFAKSIGFHVPILTLGGIIAIMSISNLLPITFSGVGTRDAVFIYCFGQIDVAPEYAISLSFIILGSNIFNGTLGSLLFILFPPAFSFEDLSKSMDKG